MTTPAVGTFTASLTHSLDTGIEPAFVLSLGLRGGFLGSLVEGTGVCLQRSRKGVTNRGARYLGSGLALAQPQRLGPHVCDGKALMLAKPKLSGWFLELTNYPFSNRKSQDRAYPNETYSMPGPLGFLQHGIDIPILQQGSLDPKRPTD